MSTHGGVSRQPSLGVLRACLRKTAAGNVQDDEGEASREALRMRVNTGIDIREYRCPVCRRWHVGSWSKQGGK